MITDTRWRRDATKCLSEEAWELEDRQKTKDELIQELAGMRERASVLEEMVEELVRSNQELTQFADVISHDLQEPLRTTASFLELLKERYHGRLDRQADKFIDYAVRGSLRMSRMVQDLLTLARLRARGRAFTMVDCESVLAQTLSDLQAAIEESGAEVTHDPLPCLEADRHQLGQLLQNLIVNSIKFRGPSAPRIHIGLASDNGQYTFAVSDNGIGFEARDVDRVFNVFERLHGPDEYSGTGIGLAICRRVVERHGGSIRAESSPGNGSTFYFTLPADQTTHGTGRGD